MDLIMKYILLFYNLILNIFPDETRKLIYISYF